MTMGENPPVGAVCIYCEDHPQVEAVGRCLVCGRTLCRACLNPHDERIYCAEHLEAATSSGDCPTSRDIPFAAGELTDFGTRAVAYIIDGLILACAVSIAFRLYFAFHAFDRSYFEYFLWMNLLFAILLGVYCTVFVGLRGQTLGHAAMGIRVVGEKGESVGYERAFKRWLGYLFCTIPFFAGFLAIMRDPHRQGWHDHMVNTLVVGKSLSVKEKVAWGIGLTLFGVPLLAIIFLQVYAPY